jgi:protein-disulfide isomerase
MSTSKFKISTSLFFLSIASALGIHAYLISEHISVKYSYNEGSSICNLSETVNCATTIMSNYSELFGVPLAVFGFVMGLFTFFFALKGLFLDQDPKKSMAITVGLSIISVVASVVMGLISIFVLKSICPFCTMAYALSFITLFTALQWTNGFTTTTAAEYGKNIALQLVAIGAVGFIAGKIVLAPYNSSERTEMTRLIVNDWASKPPQEILLVDPLVLGPDSASMKILEFSDFLCPHCKHALPKLHAFVKHNKDVQIIFQNFPLDNCAGPADSPGRRCDLAKIAYCSQKQNRGWEAQEYLFSTQENLYNVTDLDAELPQIASVVQLDLEVLKKCVKAPETLTTVKAQQELGKKLGVEGTPALFINNKKFPSVGPEVNILQEIYKVIKK